MRILILILLPFLFLQASAQRYVVSPGEYTCPMVDTVAKKGYMIDGNAYLCPGLPTSGVTGCAGGAHHAGFIVGGNVWMLGENESGELGNGTVGGSTSSASQISTDSAGNTFTNVVQLCLGNGQQGQAAGGGDGWTSAALKSDGTVWIWGWTDGIRGSGTAYTGSPATSKPVQVHFPSGTFITKIQITTSAMALDSAGHVWTWGTNNIYQWEYTTGQGSSPNVTTPTQVSLPARAVDIAGGTYFNYALLNNGSLYGWGPWAGYLGIGGGDGSQYDYETPSMGSINSSGAPMLLDTALNLPHTIAKIYTNSEGTFAILTDSTLWAWGDNAVGNMGQGTELNFATYVNNGSPAPYSWNLGYGEMMIRKPVAIAPGKHNFTHVYVGNALCYYVFADDGDGNLYSWGRDKGGVLGQSLIACDSVIGNISGTYPNSWDRTYPTLINPDSLFSSSHYYSTCPLCIANHTNPPCSLCTYPAATSVTTSLTATQSGGSTVILAGTASSSNHMMFRTFSQVSGAAVDMGIQTGAADTIYHVSPGSYTFRYKAIDAYWNMDSSTAYITVSSGRDSIRIQFDTVTSIYGNPVTQSNFVQMMGDPSTHVITATGGNNNSITVSSISTANWTALWGYSASPGGEIPTSFFPGADTALSQVWINAASAYTSGVYQVEVSGLNPSSTYLIQLSASADPDAFYQVPCQGEYRWFGATASSVDSLDAQPSGVANTSSGLTWSSVQPNSSGQLFLAFNAAGSSQTAGFLGAISITENSSGGGSAVKGTPVSATTNGGLSDLTANSSDVVIYPNPTKGEVFVKLGNGLGNGAVITLYGADGQVVTRKQVMGADQVLTLGGMPAGVYILRVSSGEKSVTRRVIKN